MFTSLSSFLPSALQQVSLGARPPDAPSPPPTILPDPPQPDPPRKKEKKEKEKHASEVCPLHVSTSNSHLATRLSSSSALPRQSLLSHSASRSSLFPHSPVTIELYRLSTPPLMILAPNSDAPTPTVQRRPPTQAIPQPALSLLFHPLPQAVQVVA